MQNRMFAVIQSAFENYIIGVLAPRSAFAATKVLT